MQNFPFEYNGETFWYSRALAVTGFVFCNFDGVIKILVNKRGKGTPDFQGCWNVPCGYLDFNETAEEAACREVGEETGVVISPDAFELWTVNSSPKENRQNVTMRFIGAIDREVADLTTGKLVNGGEQDEVDEIKWMTLKEINNYEWAFNHKELIEEAFKTVIW